MAISDALPLEVPVLQGRSRGPPAYQISAKLSIHGWVINDSTNLPGTI